MTTRQLTLLAVALLALAWPFLPSFTITLLAYIGLYSMVAVGLVLLTGVGGITSPRSTIRVAPRSSRSTSMSFGIRW